MRSQSSALPDDSAYQATILKESSLIGYWPCDEGNYLYKDRTANARNATPSGTLPGAFAPHNTRLLSGAKYNGTNHYSQVAHNTAFDFSGVGRPSFTIECVFAHDDAALGRLLVSKEKTTATFAGWRLGVASGKFYGVRQGNYVPGFTECIGTTTLLVGRIYHFAWTYDGSNQKGYVSGTLDKTQADTTTMDADTFAVGFADAVSATPFSPHKGYVGHIAIYNAALTADQVKTHAAAIL